MLSMDQSQARDDHHLARELLKSGQIVSVETLLEKVKTQYTGHILKIKLDDEDDAKSGWAYEIKLLRDDGAVVEIEYDAKTLEVIKIEEGKIKKDHK
jgi:uncharacterized membrane protein YkoI